MSIRSKLSSLREYLTPIQHNSNFATTGEISPDEFVAAGDYLVYKFPTWEWSSAPDKLRKDFLPQDKQFLVTKHVPSYQRCADYLGVDLDGSDSTAEEEIDEDGWVKSKRVLKVNEETIQGQDSQQHNNNEVNDIDDLIDENAEDDSDDIAMEFGDEDGFQHLGNSNTTLRKYDLYICYSTSYRVPKLYLVGFNANGIPLVPEQMFEDISGDYRDKTATIETLPVSFNTTSVSIHPCRHAKVMKVLMAHVKQKDQQGIKVDQYLIVFLKFIASVTPGIEYDYTMDAL